MGIFSFVTNFIPGVGPFISTGLSFVGKYWKEFAVGAMIGIIAYQNFSATRFLLGAPTIPHLQQVVAQDQVQIKTLTGQVKQAGDANASLTNDIKAVNADVAKWKAISDQLQAQNDALQGKLNAIQVQTQTKINNISKLPTPTTCEGSMDLLRKQIPNLTW